MAKKKKKKKNNLKNHEVDPNRAFQNMTGRNFKSNVQFLGIGCPLLCPWIQKF